MPTLITPTIARKKLITTEDDGKFLLLSDTGGNWAGVWVFEFVPDPGDPFDGQLSIQGRIQGQQAFDDDVPFDVIPYKAAILNGVVSDYSLTTDYITGHSFLTIPASGASIAVLVSCTGGKGTLYSYPRQGDTGLGGGGLGSGVTTVGAEIVTVTATFTRPANTTAYTAGDVVSNNATTSTLLVLPNVVRAAGGSGTLLGAILETSGPSLPTFPSQMTASFFSAPVPTVTWAADNAAATTIGANALYRLATVSFPPLAGGTGTNTSLTAEATPPYKTMTCASGSRDWHVGFVDNTGSTPISAQTFRLTVVVAQQ